MPRDPFLLSILSRLNNYRGDRGLAYLSGKDAYILERYPEWIRNNISLDDRDYGELLIAVQTGVNHEKKFRLLFGRTNFHLGRLLARTSSEAERVFAKAMVIYGPALYNQISERLDLYARVRAMRNVLGGENDNVSFWWTVSPYLYKLMICGGLSEIESIRRLFNWAANAPARETENGLVLPGTEWIPWERCGFVLTPVNENTWTHETAMLIADYLLITLLAQEEPIILNDLS